MLLGADGDAFDANAVEIPAHVGNSQANKSAGDTVLAYYGSQNVEAGIASQDWRHGTNTNVETQHDYRFRSQRVYEDVAAQEYENFVPDDHDWRQQQPGQDGLQSPYVPEYTTTQPYEVGLDVEQLQRELAESVSENAFDEPQPHDTDAELGSEWERFLGVPSRTTKDASTAALNSSSEHHTTSESSQRPLHRHVSADEIRSGTQILTPNGAGTQASFLPHDPRDTNHSGTTPDSGMQSPSASLQQISNLARQPATPHQPRPPTARGKDSDDDELWRQFIIGGRGSDGSEDGDFGLGRSPRAKRMSTSDAQSPAADATTTASVSATRGRSLFVTGVTSSISILASDGHHRGDDPVDVARTDNKSLVVEPESIQEVTPSPIATKPRVNIHAQANTHLSPKRFKKPARQPQAQLTSKFTHNSIPHTTKRRRTERH